MLKQLTVQNFIIVNHLNIDFEKGLTTITGESGAGKSILLGALNLILGQRSSADMVRPGASHANITAEFEFGDMHQSRKILEDAGISLDEQTGCLIRRTISADGGSKAFINETPVTLRFLQETTGTLINICDQNENQNLTETSSQVAFLDNYAGAADTATSTRELYKDWQQMLKRVDELEQTNQRETDRKELLNYQLNELRSLSLLENEFEQVETEHRRLSNSKELIDSTENVLQVISRLEELRQSNAKIAGINDSSPHLDSAKENLSSALSLIDDAERDLKKYQDQVVVDPDHLDQLESRLSAILTTAKKHRIEPGEVHSHTQRLEDSLDSIKDLEIELTQLRKSSEELEQKFLEESKKLSKRRRQYSDQFCADVGAHMSALGINNGRLSINFKEHISIHGIETAEFKVQTNPKFEPAPLKKVASGGEQTRIFLSIQIVAAKTTQLPSLILDEADVGVGGTTADTIGRLLLDLGANTQVICITHAPQVAAIGQNHMRVVKEDSEATIESLDYDMRIEELARMLAGSGITEKTRDYANTLLKEASRK
tara:strand:- start:807 stop:2447 length:1641 start_codon:yes stop_codon:yes gene_type:complete